MVLCEIFDVWTADRTEAKIEVTDELNVESRSSVDQGFKKKKI